MATYKFTATITVTNSRSKRDAINQLQVMLNDYEDMNSSSDKEIFISLGASEKVKGEDALRLMERRYEEHTEMA